MSEINEVTKSVSLIACPTCGLAPILYYRDDQYHVDCEDCSLSFSVADSDLSEACKSWNKSAKVRYFDVPIPEVKPRMANCIDLTVHADAEISCPICGYAVAERGLLFIKAQHLCHGFEPEAVLTKNSTGLPKRHTCDVCSCKFSATPVFNQDQTEILQVMLRFVPSASKLKTKKD